MKSAAGLLLFLLSIGAEGYADDSAYRFFPKPGIDQLVYEIDSWWLLDTSPAKRDTTSVSKMEVDIHRDSAVDGMILDVRETGPAAGASNEYDYLDTCRVTGSQFVCAKQSGIFMGRPLGNTAARGAYYHLGDSVYFLFHESTSFSPGGPGNWGSETSEYFLNDVGLIYESRWEGFSRLTTETVLKRINGVPVPPFDSDKLKNPNSIGIGIAPASRPSLRKGPGMFEKFILNQYLLGRRMGKD